MGPRGQAWYRCDMWRRFWSGLCFVRQFQRAAYRNLSSRRYFIFSQLAPAYLAGDGFISFFAKPLLYNWFERRAATASLIHCARWLLMHDTFSNWWLLLIHIHIAFWLRHSNLSLAVILLIDWHANYSFWFQEKSIANCISHFKYKNELATSLWNYENAAL